MKRVFIGLLLAAVFSTLVSASDVPKALKARFVIGEPVWRELPIRDDLQTQYAKCWETAVSSILDNNFDIATMDKDSGYARTTWNEGVVVLNGNWNYKLQISIKLVPGTDAKGGLTAQKLRVQVAGDLANVNRGKVQSYFHGYDKVLLQNLFQDLQSKLGSH